MDRQLLQRYVEGNVTAEEVERVVDWLDENKENVHEFMALRKLYTISLLNKPIHRTSKTLPIKKYTIRKIGFEFLKIAVIFLLVVGIYEWNKETKIEDPVKETSVFSYQTITVPAGQRAEVLLPDSTIVWLNSRTTLTYPSNFAMNNREVKLEGEAYFDVKHNKEKTFLVRTDKIDIEVYGTEFNVRAYKELVDPEVALINGSIELFVNNTQIKYEMHPNDLVRLSSEKLYKTSITNPDYFKWKEGILSFTNESVTSMIKRIELVFDTKINVQKTDLLSHYYTGKFRVDDGLEQIFKVLQLEHQFIFVRDKNLNLITLK